MLSVVIEAILRIQAAIIVFLVSLPFWPSGYWSQLELLAITGVLLLGLVAVHPRVLNGCISLVSRLFRRPPIDIASLRYHHLLMLLLGHVLASLVAGLAFYGLVTSVHSLPANSALPVAGMLAISVVVGFLNPLTPHGLGTREGLLIILLNLYLPVPVAIVISLLSRLWLTAAELLGTLFISLVLRE